MPTRRELIKAGIYGSTALLGLTGPRLDIWALKDGGSNGGFGGSPRVAPFQVDLPIPTVKTPVPLASLPGAPVFNDGQPTDYYSSTEQVALQQILPGQKTLVWTYDGTYPGPTYTPRLNRRIVIRQTNHLPANTVVHQHGGHTQAASDGSAFPDEEIPVGGFRDYIYDNDSDVGAFLWYHDHTLDFTGHNVFMGLSGLFLLGSDSIDALNLPSGPFDIALVFQDRTFDANNQLVYNPFDHDGFLGDTFLVNGAVQPRLRVGNRKYKFRTLNGSNARFYEISLSSGRPFQIIGSDGGCLRAPFETTSYRLAPAERVEIVVDFSFYAPGPNTHVFLNNTMIQTSGRGPDGVDPTQPTPLVRFDVLDSVADNSTVPAILETGLPTFNPAASVITREFDFVRSQGAWQVNNRFFDPNRVDAKVKLNTTEIWKLKNGGGGWFHPIHIHRNEFYILDRNGIPPVGPEAGLKDVFVLNPGDEVRVITSYTGAKQLGKYVFHCHNIEHEDMRMMGRFDVVL
ncbi:MAG TPA: multicopper oxidase domain-containing protein [Candidatus Angelobacter sp.]|nr:multicopper oxidase domain-containing protein [Candidatus Angelobacter sp.]